MLGNQSFAKNDKKPLAALPQLRAFIIQTHRQAGENHSPTPKPPDSQNDGSSDACYQIVIKGWLESSKIVANKGDSAIPCSFPLNNPEKAGICRAADYEWSSYGQYDDPAAFVDTSLLRELIGDAGAYEAFMRKEDDAECMEFEPRRHDDEWASGIIRKRLKLNSGTELQSLDRDERNAALRTLKAAGITVRQLERLTGINRGVIQRV